MNYFQIQAFLRIAETKSLSKAAQILYVSQSTVSHRLSTLEEELNTTLVLRKKGFRTIDLTPAGERFVSLAHRWDALWEETEKLGSYVPTTSLVIGGVDSVSTYFLSSFFHQLRERESSLSCTIHFCNNSSQAYHLLENHEVDVAFVTVPIWNKNILIEPILSEPFKLLCSRQQQENEPFVRPETLDPTHEIFQPWGPEYQQWHDYWWPTPQNPYVTLDATCMLGEYLKDKNLWTIVPECVARRFVKTYDVQALSLFSPPPKHIGYKATHRYPREASSSAIDTFEKYLKRFLLKQDLAYSRSSW